jgi:hypothetical protein
MVLSTYENLKANLVSFEKCSSSVHIKVGVFSLDGNETSGFISCPDGRLSAFKDSLELYVCMYEGWPKYPALAPRPSMIY